MANRGLWIGGSSLATRSIFDDPPPPPLDRAEFAFTMIVRERIGVVLTMIGLIAFGIVTFRPRGEHVSRERGS